MTTALVLASASPRRRELLGQLEIQFEIVPSTVPEVPAAGERAEAFAQRIARDKALEVAQRRPGQWVLAADTVVVCDGAILGKPADRTEARRMLTMLAARSHRVLTAVALASPADALVEERLVATTVTFRALAAGEIEAYLDTGEPFDKAGAYAIQGQAAAFVTAIDGSWSNVVGLPLEEVRELLQRHGLLAVAAAASA
ncbi:MAG: septum formation inhibitor Maf [Deltaproteobacteria bacterium]|nr:septum formation inhibitor Maf [Deltaproteobacteria bacterium]